MINVSAYLILQVCRALVVGHEFVHVNPSTRDPLNVFPPNDTCTLPTTICQVIMQSGTDDGITRSLWLPSSSWKEVIVTALVHAFTYEQTHTHILRNLCVCICPCVPEISTLWFPSMHHYQHIHMSLKALNFTPRAESSTESQRQCVYSFYGQVRTQSTQSNLGWPIPNSWCQIMEVYYVLLHHMLARTQYCWQWYPLLWKLCVIAALCGGCDNRQRIIIYVCSHQQQYTHPWFSNTQSHTHANTLLYCHHEDPHWVHSFPPWF